MIISLNTESKKNAQFTERSFFATLFALAEAEDFKINVTRCDFAFDDIAYNNGHHLLEFDTVKKTVLNGEVVTRFRHRTCVTDGTVMTAPDSQTEFLIYEKGSSKTKFKGSTIYLGSRSGTHMRFYDKVAELQAHGKEMDKNITHWLRVELQACRDNAMAILSQFILLDEREFSTYISKVILNMVRFVDISKENLSSNHYRCPVKSWWAQFLGVVQRSRLIHKKPKVNKFNKSVNWLKNNVSATFAVVTKAVGFHNACGILREGAIEHYNSKHDLIVDDYVNYGTYDADQLHGEDAYKVYFANDKEFREFLIEMRKLHEESLHQIIEKAKADQVPLSWDNVS